MTASRSGKTIATSFAKRWSFRLLAVLLGCAPLVVVEAFLRTADWGSVSELQDPYVGFDEVRRLFILDEDRQEYMTDPARVAYFRPERFAARKPHDERRVFCLGGSTVQGRPYAIETSFTSWLEISLQAADPRWKWEVVNCGGVSYASYRLVPILEELLEYEPDLFILYSGHNEFLEDRTYRQIKQTPRAVARLHGLGSRLRTYNVCRSAWLRLRQQDWASPPRPTSVLPGEVDALLDYSGGLADYHRDDAWRQGAVEHYGLNLGRMIQRARTADVPLVLVNPISNLRDCPPFKSQHRADLSDRELADFTTLWQAASRCDDLTERIALLERAVSIDEQFAAALFALAKSYEAAGRYDDARPIYLRAKEEDVCPLRMIEPLHDLLVATARRTNTPLVDARAMFHAHSRHGIPGNDWLLDHVHPSINGHQEIAQLIFDQLTQIGFVEPQPGWELTRKTRYASHLAALQPAYFVHGTQRLEGLLRWTKGQARGKTRAAAAPAGKQ